MNQTSLFNSPRRRRASALMLMVWAILLMSITVMGVVEYISYSLDEATIASAEFRALYLAESGLAVGLHPNTSRNDVVLKQKVTPDSGFDVVINYEGARLPINFITDERVYEAVYNLFVYWGLNTDEATICADSLADWVDRDEDTRPNGAEADYYESFGIYDIPRQQGFLTIEEILLVRGMGVVDRLKPTWREYFSIPGTEDDRRIRTSEAFQLLGLSGAQASSLSSVLNDDDLVRRITSTGYVGEKRAQIIVIARRGDDRSLTYLGRIEE